MLMRFEIRRNGLLKLLRTLLSRLSNYVRGMLDLPELDLLHLLRVYELDFNRLFRQFLAINLLNMNDSWTGD